MDEANPQSALEKSRAMTAAVRDVLAAVSVADGDRARPFFADDLKMELPFSRPPFPQERRGGDTISASLTGSKAILQDFTLKPTKFYPSPETDSIVVEAESSGKLVKGGDYANQYVFIFTFVNGKIALWREYFDPLRLPHLT